uniref:peptide-methionine (S)-S-oxide reductase n=1 Tax=Pavo cristatus TaxID=9049 RepID=A0A8C9EN27_PAVCR
MTAEDPTRDKHHVNGNRMAEPFPEGMQMAIFGMGCFWGAERKFWRQKGVYSTHVGYAGGYTPNPTYKEVCSGRTGHTEAVRVVYQPENISFEKLLKVFWENHDPTQGMRQGNDFGTQYRSAIYTFSQEQMEAALKSKEEYQKDLSCKAVILESFSAGKDCDTNRNPACNLNQLVKRLRKQNKAVTVPKLELNNANGLLWGLQVSLRNSKSIVPGHEEIEFKKYII